MIFPLLSLIKSDDNSGLIDFFAPVVTVYWSFIVIFGYCELGELLSAEFIKFDDELCQCKWYLFPIEVKQIISIFMGETQQLTVFRGYGNIECTRQSFKEVIHLFLSFLCLI